MKITKRYKFLREGFKSDKGDTKWEIGKWQKHKGGRLGMCASGFHCSVEPYDAFSCVQGEILAEVEVRGESIKKDDKQVWSETKVVKAYRWTKKDNLKLAIFAAELVLGNFEKVYPDDKRPREAIEAAKKVLFRDIEANRSAAWLAWSAAWSAERSAAMSAAMSAAESAWSAAESAWSAAMSAAGSATIAKIQRYFRKLVKGLKEVK